jgi:hypothetical protein
MRNSHTTRNTICICAQQEMYIIPCILVTVTRAQQIHRHTCTMYVYPTGVWFSKYGNITIQQWGKWAHDYCYCANKTRLAECGGHECDHVWRFTHWLQWLSAHSMASWSLTTHCNSIIYMYIYNVHVFVSKTGQSRPSWSLSICSVALNKLQLNNCCWEDLCMYTNTVMVGPDKPAIHGRRLFFELVKLALINREYTIYYIKYM